MSLIEISKLTKTYRAGDAQVHALHDVTARIDEAAFVSVVGPSGSGKTTLLNLVGCLDVPTSGHIRVLDQDVTSLSRRERTAFRGRHVGFIFQDFNLVPVLNVYENVEYPLRMVNGLPAAERRERITKVIEAVDLADQAGKRPDQLSGGQKQRAAIARALVTRPRLALADEPTANLDHATAFRIIALMKKMRDEFGTTFLFSTHDSRIVDEAEHILELEDGRLMAEKGREGGGND